MGRKRGGRRGGARSRRPVLARRLRPPLWKRHATLIRAWIYFFVFLGTANAVLYASEPHLWNALNAMTAHLAAWSLWLLGYESEVRGTLVVSSLHSLRIIGECTAVHPLILYVGAVVAYPCRWRPKLAGILLGVPAVLIVNQVRLVSLFFVGRWYPDAFETVHVVIWQSLIVFVVVLFWIAWAVGFVRSHDTRLA